MTVHYPVGRKTTWSFWEAYSNNIMPKSIKHIRIFDCFQKSERNHVGFASFI